MKITLAGGYDTQNLGDYASFLGLEKLLRKYIPDAKFTVLSRHPNDRFGKEFDVATILNLDHSDKISAKGRIFNGFNEYDDDTHLNTIARELMDSDVLIFGNGRLFVDISLGFMSGPLNYFCILTLLARFLGKPIVLSSVTLVHPSTEAGKELLRFILRNARLILTREQSSADIACDYVDNRAKVVVLPDIAFAVTKTDSTGEGLPEIPHNSIGVNFRGVNFSNESTKDRFTQIAKKLAELMDQMDCATVFCHQCTYDVDTPLTDDRHANAQVYAALPHKYQRKCLISRNKWSLAQTLGIYGKLRHLVTERRHGFILSLTQETPASLICHESNTAVVSETVPLQGAYLKAGESLSMNVSNTSFDTDWLEDIRQQLEEYPRQFLKLMETE